jgi:hypothetical protein
VLKQEGRAVDLDALTMGARCSGHAPQYGFWWLSAG